uniref:SHSP domain-containing protein n=1 Tax=Romanomermis culicivorax TaxID=13658 RepID=A0A915IC60_ROMCU
MAPIFAKKSTTKPAGLAAKKWDWPLQKNDGAVLLINNSERFKVELDLANFKPNEIEVKILNEELIVNCCEERSDDKRPRQIHRSYRLPSDIDVSTVKTIFPAKNVLQITAEKIKSPFGQIVLNKVNRFA